MQVIAECLDSPPLSFFWAGWHRHTQATAGRERERATRIKMQYVVQEDARPGSLDIPPTSARRPRQRPTFDWELDPEDLEICFKPGTLVWDELGHGAYGQVRHALPSLTTPLCVVCVQRAGSIGHVQWMEGRVEEVCVFFFAIIPGSFGKLIVHVDFLLKWLLRLCVVSCLGKDRGPERSHHNTC